MSTIKSSAENLTLNADGANNDVIIQSNGSTKVTVDGATGDTNFTAKIQQGGSDILSYAGGITTLGSQGTWLDLGRSATTTMRLMSGGAEKARISSVGLTFNGDTAAANALDDYEEGTWTPVIIGTSSAGTANHSAQLGKYTKIGNQVTLWGYVAWDSGTGSGNLVVNGAPFTAISEHTAHGSVQWNSGLSYPTGGKDANWVVDPSSYTGFYIRCNKDNAQWGYVPYTAAGDYVRICLTYQTNS